MAEILTINSHSVEATLSEPVSWQQAMKRAIRSGRALCDLLGLDPWAPAPKGIGNPSLAQLAESDFPVFVPWEYAARMRPGDVDDPLLRQVLAVAAERAADPTGMLDPVGDLAAERVPGLLHKYDSRVLLVTTGACAVHCRYCFRRHYPYHTAPRGRENWKPALATIAADQTLDEVILSGGDPLTLADDALAWLVDQLDNLAHIRRIRVHTRVPVVIPQRINDSLLAWVSATHTPLYFVLHFNHERELDTATTAALERLRRAGATLLNQAVLLRGVNDTLEAQRDLCLKLVDHHVLPYYLHQLDLVQGALHFEVSDEHAVDLIESLRSQLPGYAVPKLVREVAGQHSKTPIV